MKTHKNAQDLLDWLNNLSKSVDLKEMNFAVEEPSDDGPKSFVIVGNETEIYSIANWHEDEVVEKLEGNVIPFRKKV